MNSNIIPVILCGGYGTRLWPLSRESFPKQFLSLSNANESLLQKTIKRLSGLENLGEPILICNEDHRFIVAEQMKEINVNPDCIILEPFGKNTAPAISIAALKSLKGKKDPLLLVLSSDHEIKSEKNFIETIKKGVIYANNNKIIAFGIIPSCPEIGYGYIKSDMPYTDNENEGQNIIEFTEKPNKEKAEKFIKDKRYTWNSGMFMFKASTIIEELKKFTPEIINTCKVALETSKHDLDFDRLDKDSFEKCPNISIDYAVMEKTKKGVVLPLDAGWSDIGSWEAVWETKVKDNKGNYIEGKTYLENSMNCYVKSEDRLVVGIGLENLIVVDTSDAILISSKGETQKVKKVVSQLKQKNISEGRKHRKIYRPWGYYLSIVEDSRWQVKLIQVKAGEKISLQLHHHRSEHWIIVKGTANVEVDNATKVLTENQSIYIPLGSKHRLSNPGKIPLVLIEVQSGSYVGEDDIVRFDDKYGRLEK